MLPLQRARRLPALLPGLRMFAPVLALVLAALAVWLADPVVLQNLRLAQYDQFQRWHPRPYTPAPVRIVDLDEATLRTHGQWPWPRTQVADLVERMDAAGAAVIAMDVLMSEPDRTSPAPMARLWRRPELDAALAALPDHDEALARRLEGRPVVLGATLDRNPVTGADGNPAPAHVPEALPYRVVTSSPAPLQPWLGGFRAAVWPLPVLLRTASGVGALNAAADPDGIVRRVPLLMRLDDAIVPGLSAEALRVAQGARNYLVRGTEGGVQDVRIGQAVVDTTAEAELWLHYTADPAVRVVSAGAVLDGRAPPEALRGAIVLVGSSAQGLMDLRLNPLGQVVPGVQAHAQALEQMLLGHYLQRPSWARGAEATALLLGSLLLGLVGLAAPARWATAALGALLALLWSGAWYGFVAHNLLIDATAGTATLLLVFGLASGSHHLASERQQRWLRSAFARYVSPNRVAHLVAHPEQLELGGRRQVCSFVFTDLAGFTRMMESGDPVVQVARLNTYLDGMLEIVFRHEGTLDRIVGDAVAVMFSAPVEQPDHRERALRCALDMDAFARRHAEELKAEGVDWGHTRIGVHTGEVLVGNFGGSTMFDYRALGDAVNTAARLESVNKHLGTRVCVSGTVIEGSEGAGMRRIGRLVLKGKSVPLEVFTPEASMEAGLSAGAADYEAALCLLAPGAQHDAADARGRLESLAARHPQDPLVLLHLQRLRAGADDDLIVMSEK